MNDLEIADRLIAHLRSDLGDRALDYAEPLKRIHGGYETSVFGFRLNRAEGEWSRALILRMFQSQDPVRARLETVIQNTVADLGYPAPRVLLTGSGGNLLDGAFVVMERMPGRMMAEGFEGLGRDQGASGVLDLMLRVPNLLREIPRELAEVQARLHALGAERLLAAVEAAGLPSSLITFAGRLMWLDAATRLKEFSGLRPAARWLLDNQPKTPEPAVICHGDFQPFNILLVDGKLTGVIDWPNTTVGERALDVGFSKAGFETVPFEVPAFLRGLARLVQKTLARGYLEAYTRLHTLDPAAVRYYGVLRCVGELAHVAGALTQRKSGLGAFGTPRGVRRLVAYVRRITEVEISMPSIPLVG